MIVRQSNRVAAMEEPTREDLMAVLPADLQEPDEDEAAEEAPAEPAEAESAEETPAAEE